GRTARHHMPVRHNKPVTGQDDTRASTLFGLAATVAEAEEATKSAGVLRLARHVYRNDALTDIFCDIADDGGLTLELNFLFGYVLGAVIVVGCSTEPAAAESKRQHYDSTESERQRTFPHIVNREAGQFWRW